MPLGPSGLSQTAGTFRGVPTRLLRPTARPCDGWGHTHVRPPLPPEVRLEMSQAPMPEDPTQGHSWRAEVTAGRCASHIPADLRADEV